MSRRLASPEQAAPGGEGGKTALEILVTVTLIAGLVLAVGAVLRTGLTAYGETRATVVERKAFQTVDRIVAELTSAGGQTVEFETVGTSGSSLRFRNCTGSVSGVKQWSPLNVIEWQPDPRDPEDGLDNDGDGLVDEGRVALRVRADEVDEVQTILVQGVANRLEGEVANGADDNANQLVDERGLSFELDGSVLRIRLTLESVGPEASVTQTVRSAVALRN